MLGGEQDCYGGCTDAGQGYYGLLDEVRPAKPSHVHVAQFLACPGQTPAAQSVLNAHPQAMQLWLNY